MACLTTSVPLYDANGVQFEEARMKEYQSNFTVEQQRSLLTGQLRFFHQLESAFRYESDADWRSRV